MFEKFIEIDRQYPKTGEPTVQPVVRWSGGRSFVEKRANPNSPAFSYIQSVKPRDGKTVVLVNAMGGFERYDANRNGDGFPTKPYRVGVRAPAGRPKWGDQLDGWIREDQCLQYHYPSFKNAGIFEHHQNKDMSRSLGRIERAFWNDYMCRVELLLEIDNTRQPQLIERINDGDSPAVSMGCRIKYDVCTVCGNRAPTRADYCDHLQYQMNFLDPATGLLWCALNPDPDFFDISFVFRPADPTGFLLFKAASERGSTHPYEIRPFENEQKVAAYSAKQSTVRKVGAMQKEVVDGRIMAARSAVGEMVRRNTENMESATDADVAELAKEPLSDVIATTAKAGALMSSGEFARVFAKKAGLRLTETHLDKIALLQPALIEMFALYPESFSKLAETLYPKTARVRPEILEKVAGWTEKRSSSWRSIHRQVMEPGFVPNSFGPGYRYNATTPAKTDMLNLTDPTTGSMYSTTRGAAQEADTAYRRKLLGATAMATGTYLLGSSLIPGVKHLPLGVRGAGSALAGYLTADKGMQMVAPTGGTHYMTDEGVPIRSSTEFTKMNSEFLSKLAFDVYERLGSWPSDHKLAAALCRKCQKSQIRGLVTSGTAEKTAELLRPFQAWNGDPYTAPTLKIASAAELFGALLDR